MLKEQIINSINDKIIMVEIIKGLTAIKYTCEVTSEWVLSLAERTEV